MHFQSIIAVLAMAVAATAAPSPNSSPAPSPQCQADQTTACCTSSFTGVLLPGVTCIVVNVIGVLNPTCPTNQQLACCNSGAQTGNVIAVGTICAPINIS